jgi:cell division protein FtsB
VLAVIVLALGMALVVPLRQYLAQRAQIAELEHELAALRAERTQLEHRIEQFHNPAYLERQARRCLGMIRPGEIVFVPVPEEGEPARPSRC